MTISPLAAINPASLPRASDQRQVDLHLEQLAQILTPEEAALLQSSPIAAALLAALCGNSPFLGRCLLAEPKTFLELLSQDVDSVFNNVVTAVTPKALENLTESELMSALRRARRQVALIVATGDVSGLWTLEKVTAALTRFAETTLSATLCHLLRQLAATGEITLTNPDDPELDSGFIILGLGKLGARELNYSSDIDLILLFEREKIQYTGRKTVQECFVRLARNLVRILQDGTAEGYVFRIDLRLRPDPASTPLVISTLAAETYYEGMGQNWERAAMIKARVVAGDQAAGALFLYRLRPFIWRKHLDFAAIQDIHSIKRQIYAVKGHRHVAVAGHNIKLGRGGIREIEFFAQTQQLIWGRRAKELRQRTTCGAIEGLVQVGKCSRGVADELIRAYRYLRQVEHRLQMIDDQQTQTLPDYGPALDRVALFNGHTDTAEFEATLRFHLGRVEDHYAELFEEAPSLGAAEAGVTGSLVFTGTEDDPETVLTLERMGFTDGSAVSAQIRAWHHGRYRATRSARARELLTELMPRLLAALSNTADPDTAFRRFDDFLRALPAGVQFFALLYSNPALLDLIAEAMGMAPFLAEQLARRPALLDGVLAAGLYDACSDPAALATDLERQLDLAEDFQDALDILRRWTKDQQFQIGVRLLRGSLDGDTAGPLLSDVADCALAALFPRVVAEFEQQHGKLPGRGLALLALGKLGSREMTVTSDLDLVFIYDIPSNVENWDTAQSSGLKPLPPIQYYARLAQRLISAITAQTGEGRLFEVDMRLRPSGNSGPIASGLAPFEKYQLEEAWTWEHMALTRARFIAGHPTFGAEIQASLARVICQRRDPYKLRADILDMRRRMAQQYRTDDIWDLKHCRGGQIDIDFISQYLILRHAVDYPEIIAGDPVLALGRMRDRGLLDLVAGDKLISTAQLWHRLQQVIRLVLDERLDDHRLSEPTKRQLAQSASEPDFSALKALVLEREAEVFALFNTIFEIDSLESGGDGNGS
ncbi:bifunctional [glutamine synthetase] adenylyltransferase/[glutamine synthetase]-adenylyl-L-tyrosine phosphorylase [Dongia sp.]|uniref:bifunctional [glutamine synthetase] adenylyltransferase/[glutamine synthetase]-adenylyl-L-tyrosine phosphorylase n=1 Tax=Dongia sp. TaxID=1977262 RepID=UPI0035B2B419